MARTADDLLTMFRLGKQSQPNFGMQIPNKDVAMSKRGDMAKEWYEGWKKQNGLPADSNALPPVDSTPPWARPYLFPRAEATPNKGMLIANFLTGKTGEGKTLTDEAYDAGYDTIMETTEPDSYTRHERLKILNHQYFDQI